MKNNKLFQFISSFGMVMFLASCATEQSINEQITKGFINPTENWNNNLAKQASQAKSLVNQVKGENVSSLSLSDKTQLYKIYNNDTIDKIAITKQIQKAHLSFIKSLGEGMKKNSINDNASNQSAIEKTLDEKINSVLNQWTNRSNNVHKTSNKLYSDFFKTTTLYKLASLPMRKELFFPLPLKTQEKLDLSTDGVNQKINLLKNSLRLQYNLKEHEKIFFINAIGNCREFASYAKSLDQALPPWKLETKTLNNKFLEQSKSSFENSEKYQTFLLNRAYVADYMIRELNYSQNTPLQLAYFIVDLEKILPLLNQSKWKNDIVKLEKKYKDNFNNRKFMTYDYLKKPALKKVGVFKQNFIQKKESKEPIKTIIKKKKSKYFKPKRAPIPAHYLIHTQGRS